MNKGKIHVSAAVSESQEERDRFVFGSQVSVYVTCTACWHLQAS